MLTAKLSSLPANRVTRHHNGVCPYCGCQLELKKSTKEHVVGRRFVPRGKLDAHWNLLVNACEPCNNRKSDLEDDISAITLHPDLSGVNPDYDAAAIDEAQRKPQTRLAAAPKSQ
jgi:5-methylcytosine-specific restriction endonuclease McrA